ncbi:MAG: alpha/beta hydrolase [Acidimicrobiia bacterium]|nr:alpha/beta hydrolase [Acidimicrobiia bacterium]
MTDELVERAIAYWGPRYVENGVPVGDFFEVTRAIASWDDWCAAWVSAAGIHEREGDAAATAGHRRSAGLHYNTAAVEYHFAKFLFVHQPDEMRTAHRHAIAAHRKAHPYLAPPVERIEFPYDAEHTLVGNLRKPDGVTQPPVLVMIPGLDSAKEELSTNEDLFLDRGIATFTIDGPGQGEAEYELPIEAHYEKPVAAAIDALEARGDLDTERLGAWGVSLGGYYVVRAAAFEERIRALVSLAGPYKVDIDGISELSMRAFIRRTHSVDLDEARPRAAALDLTGVAERIGVPSYIMGGTLDKIVPPDAARQMADEIRGPVTFNMIEGGNHVSSNKTYLYRPQSADWMAAQLGASGG